MTDPTDTRHLTIGEFETACEGVTFDDLAASPLVDLTVDELAAMTPAELKETLRHAEHD